MINNFIGSTNKSCLNYSFVYPLPVFVASVVPPTHLVNSPQYSQVGTKNSKIASKCLLRGHSHTPGPRYKNPSIHHAPHIPSDHPDMGASGKSINYL